MTGYSKLMEKFFETIGEHRAWFVVVMPEFFDTVVLQRTHRADRLHLENLYQC